MSCVVDETQKRDEGKGNRHCQTQVHSACYGRWRLALEERILLRDLLLSPLAILMRKGGWNRMRKQQYLNAHVLFSDLGYPTLDAVDGDIA